MQPLTGWFGHARPFAFTPAYENAAGMARFLCGTPPVISLGVLDCALDVFDAAQALGGMAALRDKSLALGDMFMDLVEQRRIRIWHWSTHRWSLAHHLGCGCFHLFFGADLLT
jgi:kynureninase